MKKALISFSGGLDSTALLGLLINKKYQITCVFFDYGSKHNRHELHAALDITNEYQVKLIRVDLQMAMSAFKSDLLLTGGDIPEGHYEHESMKSTVVPARNMIFISILTGLAISTESNLIGLGSQAGDHFIYPDCRVDFMESMSKSIDIVSENKVQLFTPFTHMKKAQIIQLCEVFQKKTPFHLTRTCYKDQEQACGKCSACVERLEAFKDNGIPDPAYSHK